MVNPSPIPFENINIKVSMGPFLFDILLDKAFTAKGHPLQPSITHTHPAYEMHFIVHGSGVCIIDKTRITLQAGDVILIAPGVFHRFEDSDRLTKGYLQFTYSVRESNDDLFPSTEARDIAQALASIRQASVIREAPSLFDLIATIHRELSGNRFGCYAKVQGLFMQLLIHLLRNIHIATNTDETPRFPMKTKDDSRTRTIDLFFERLIHEPLKIENLAAELHLSVKQTQRVVQQLYGKSYRQMVIDLQLELAKELLTTSELTVQQIAERLGFTETRHFSRRFSQATGMTPNEFRQLYLSGPSTGNDVHELL